MMSFFYDQLPKFIPTIKELAFISTNVIFLKILGDGQKSGGYQCFPPFLLRITQRYWHFPRVKGLLPWFQKDGL